MTENGTSCPWCGSEQHPVPNHDRPGTEWQRRNPWKCPECGGVGGGEDWGMYPVEERERCPECSMPTIPANQDARYEAKLCDRCYEMEDR